MRTSLLLSLLAAGVATTQATECTYEQVAASATKTEILNANAMCHVPRGELNGTSDEETRAYCEKNEHCIMALSAALDALPDCTIQGENVRLAFAKNQRNILEACENAGLQLSTSRQRRRLKGHDGHENK